MFEFGDVRFPSWIWDRIHIVPDASRYPGPCWIWAGECTKQGYGRMQVTVSGVKKFDDLVHRVSHKVFVGPIPPRRQVDHLCRVRLCCNPDHIEAVTQRENLLRGEGFAAINAAKTHCPKGHPYDSENTYRNSKGYRYCRACHRAIYVPVEPSAPKTHCPHGHPYDVENTYVTPGGRRDCRACRKDRMIRHRSKQKAG